MFHITVITASGTNLPSCALLEAVRGHGVEIVGFFLLVTIPGN